MVLRIRVRPTRVRINGWRGLALAASALLTPGVAAALALAIWRLGADLGLLGNFVIGDGLFSHWQVWLLLAVALQMLSSALARAGQAAGASGRSRPFEESDQAMP
ncbi:MAG: hypothetical protein RMI94_05140 [Bryobacterales bacterium]|nr:hypothetical protein [Bryobacteraceae bacterium]MDW8129913.1 hypothetical protein [Bryobacterales bacterium]